MIIKRIALAMGDGSGPEMMEQAIRVIEKAAEFDDIEIKWVPTPMGWNVLDSMGDTLPEESLKAATDIGILFFGGVGDTELEKTLTPEQLKLKPEARCLLRIRKDWGLLLNFRPMTFSKAMAHIHKIRPDLLPDEPITQHWVRFLLEDTYMGTSDLWKEISVRSVLNMGLKKMLRVTGDENRVSDIGYYNRYTLETYFRYIFNYAQQLGLPVISIDKANVMARYVLWRKVCTEIHDAEFPNVELRHQLVDSANALLFTPAALKGVIACGNEHGDILSDGAAGANGSMGMMCSSAINPENGMAMFESGAGTAPTLRGLDVANPIGRILTGAMMLSHIKAPIGAAAIRNAVNLTLKDGFRTLDIASNNNTTTEMPVGTTKMATLIIDRLAA